MKTQTAVELVDAIMNGGAAIGKPIEVPWKSLFELKSAIEREQGYYDKKIYELEEKVIHQSNTIKGMNSRLQSAITMRPIMDEIKSNDGNITAILSNILRNWSVEKQRALARALLGDSMIEMRPISELPHKVPDGCVIVAMKGNDTDVFMWKHYHDIKGIAKSYKFTCFYILPLPKPARKLHACYMPGCGGIRLFVFGRNDGDYQIECEKCGAHGPIKETKQAAMDAWGYV